MTNDELAAAAGASAVKLSRALGAAVKLHAEARVQALIVRAKSLLMSEIDPPPCLSKIVRTPRSAKRSSATPRVARSVRASTRPAASAAVPTSSSFVAAAAVIASATSTVVTSVVDVAASSSAKPPIAKPSTRAEVDTDRDRIDDVDVKPPPPIARPRYDAIEIAAAKRRIAERAAAGLERGRGRPRRTDRAERDDAQPQGALAAVLPTPTFSTVV